MPHAELAGARGRRRAHRRDEAVSARQPASGDDRVRAGQGADLGDADGARTSCGCRRSCCGRTSTPDPRTSRTGMRTFREKHRARVHPLLQELPDRDLRPPDAGVRVRGRQLERADSRGRVSSACRPSTSARGSAAAIAARNVVDVGHDRSEIVAAIRAAARARALPVGSAVWRRPAPAAASPTCWRSAPLTVQKRLVFTQPLMQRARL